MTAGAPARVLDLRSLFAVEHRADVCVEPPCWVMRLLARVGRAPGYRLDG